ncbi:ABC transporter substrate-binding protein [Aeromicrobium fastidiosum]|uniref:ABC transporter substrate-binding protein n=1 Tax=Aeromicrobium fastidiosum TaxID=52699 RepID=A0A641AHS0_9ACTN|nr:ABC transporter substrate-binding protein [Aeromicrobium fastidiosum]KAA1373080.1 ABC transporter substrate-binding protein [Aeromicrobium fastidiosum]MBP2391065.1 peptide/nickel transport system substrate-binding protein [Aeromicrobium fastidiosum]
MRPTPHALKVLAVGAVASALLAGCSSSGGGTSDAKATDATIPNFTYGMKAIPATLDVANNYNSDDLPVTALVNQPLEVANLDGTFTPVLATKVSQPDDTTLVYDLRDDVTFSDGTPMTSADVVWTIGHLREKTTQTATELENFKTVEATGEHQVTITLAKPNPATRGSFAIISFVQEKAYGEKSGKDLGTAAAPPIGTGPYMIDSFSASKITLKRNPKLTGPKPAVDTFTMTTIADDNAGQLAMRSGELSGVRVSDGKSVPRWNKVQGAKVYSSPTLYLDYVTMNQTAKPFDDIHVRRAVAYATDRAGLLEANYGDQASAAVGMSPAQVDANVAPSKDALKDLVASLPDGQFSLADAKKELAQSAYPDGFTATFEYYSPQGKLVGVSLADNLKKIGVTLELKSRRLGDFIGDLFAGKRPEMGAFSIASVVADPSSWYQYLVGKDNPYNVAGYSTDATSAALEQINSSDPAERWKGVTTIETALANDVPYIALARPKYSFALGDGMTLTSAPDFMKLLSGLWVNDLKSTK